jgi:hypothetical protein
MGASHSIIRSIPSPLSLSPFFCFIFESSSDMQVETPSLKKICYLQLLQASPSSSGCWSDRRV